MRSNATSLQHCTTGSIRQRRRERLRVGDESDAPASRGLWWATVMLVFACVVLAAIVLVERSRLTTDADPAPFRPWACLGAVAASTVAQIAGIALVLRGHYRLGGIVRVEASAPHALELEGPIGVVGGIKACRSGRRAVPL